MAGKMTVVDMDGMDGGSKSSIPLRGNNTNDTDWSACKFCLIN